MANIEAVRLPPQNNQTEQKNDYVFSNTTKTKVTLELIFNNHLGVSKKPEEMNRLWTAYINWLKPQSSERFKKLIQKNSLFVEFKLILMQPGDDKNKTINFFIGIESKLKRIMIPSQDIKNIINEKIKAKPEIISTLIETMNNYQNGHLDLFEKNCNYLDKKLEEKTIIEFKKIIWDFYKKNESLGCALSDEKTILEAILSRITTKPSPTPEPTPSPTPKSKPKPSPTPMASPSPMPNAAPPPPDITTAHDAHQQAFGDITDPTPITPPPSVTYTAITPSTTAPSTQVDPPEALQEQLTHEPAATILPTIVVTDIPTTLPTKSIPAANLQALVVTLKKKNISMKELQAAATDYLQGIVVQYKISKEDMNAAIENLTVASRLLIVENKETENAITALTAVRRSITEVALQRMNVLDKKLCLHPDFSGDLSTLFKTINKLQLNDIQFPNLKEKDFDQAKKMLLAEAKDPQKQFIHLLENRLQSIISPEILMAKTCMVLLDNNMNEFIPLLGETSQRIQNNANTPPPFMLVLGIFETLDNNQKIDASLHKKVYQSFRTEHVQQIKDILTAFYNCYLGNEKPFFIALRNINFEKLLVGYFHENNIPIDEKSLQKKCAQLEKIINSDYRALVMIHGGGPKIVSTYIYPLFNKKGLQDGQNYLSMISKLIDEFENPTKVGKPN